MKKLDKPTARFIQIVTCTGIRDSTLDEVKIYVFGNFSEVPTRLRIHRATPARLERIQKYLNHHSTDLMNMEVCNWRYDNYTGKE